MATEVYSKVENGEEGASDLCLLDALYLPNSLRSWKKEETELYFS